MLADAAHLILGVAHSLHDGEPPAFDRWELIDLSKLRVRLKAEFSASNRDMYQPDAVVAGGESE